MLSEISSRELTEWMAYARLEPFGPERMETMLATFMAMFANANSDPKKGKTWEAKDFMLDFDGLLPEELRADYVPPVDFDLDEETAATYVPRANPVVSEADTQRMLESLRKFVQAFGGEDLTK